MKIKIAIAEDNYFLTKALQEKLKPYENVVIEITAANGSELLSKLSTHHNLDVIIMDIEMPVMDGIEACAQIKKLYPQLHVLMFTVFEDNEKIYRAIQAGASGYLLKDEDGATVYHALNELIQGGSALSSIIAKRTLQLLATYGQAEGLSQPKPAIELSSKEAEVLLQMSKGLNYKKIADNLSISPSTVRKHTENIYKKLGVHNKVEAISKAIELKLIAY